MRIKKILDAVGLVGNVLNQKSSSKKDAYSCDYINGIIESGSNENGSWIKFADGTMKCYGTVEYVAGKFISRDSDGYYSQVFVNKNFPMPFISKPKFTYSKVCSDDATGDWRKEEIMIAYVYPEKIDSFVFHSATNINITNTSYLDYIAIGRWK